MTFDHDFGYSFPLFSSPLRKREEEKENELAKIVIKSLAFQLGHKHGAKRKTYFFKGAKTFYLFVTGGQPLPPFLATPLFR